MPRSPVVPVLDHELTWRAMGTACRARLVGADVERAARGARALVDHLEARWSRFLPRSDVSRLNDAAGWAVPVASETVELVCTAIAWWRATGGLFDPTVHDALVAAGYDRDRASGHGPITDGVPSPGCDGIEVDPDAGTIRLPVGVRLDLGGIGKGRAVDIVRASLPGVAGGLVDLGGDLRVWGDPPEGSGWPIAVEDLRTGTPIALLGLSDGAVATSSSLRRRWTDGDRRAHHLIDPRTGTPASSELVTVTVVAGCAAAAEVLAKAALVAGTERAARRLLADHAVDALLVPRDGPAVSVGDLDALCWTAPGQVT